ncbi:MAG TPA: ABC transporter ATP-binding protein [Candidatus Thermoplasmatota archaeon]|nr:ABC transporter ATP-binding protein [Candidatus Thermoplasmatota archaeon]
MHVLVARDLAKTYGRGAAAVRALAGVTLELLPGEVVAVRGRSGSGKTTLLNLVSGLDAPDEGTVHVLGHDLARLSTAERLALRAREVGFVFQDPALVPELTLLENAALAARIRGFAPAAAREQARAALTAVGLRALADRFPAEVSGGEAQRASVARALSKEPRLLLADEPTASLDHESAALVADAIARFVREGERAAVVVTHDDVMASRATRSLRLRDGALAPQELPA